MAGMLAFTVDCVDIATRLELNQRAVWGKGETGVLEQIHDIEHSLPFPLLGFDSDNGSEFFKLPSPETLQPKEKSRSNSPGSRAYHKDDNAHVEQKNWTHVRRGWDMIA